MHKQSPPTTVARTNMEVGGADRMSHQLSSVLFHLLVCVCVCACIDPPSATKDPSHGEGDILAPHPPSHDTLILTVPT